MANIKITELNELTEIATDDVLPIVDVSADETKKVRLKNVLNVELIAVSDTAPSECSIGDKYFNTTTSLIYTAVATDTWGTTGETPVTGVFYILFNEQSSYAWNGTTLVSVGGGKEDIVIDDEEPTDPDVKLWIDTGEIAQQVSEITNSYSTSTGVGYSANYVNNLNTYSTTETRIGTWIDGKPLYRKVITGTFQTTTDYILNIITDYDTVINYSGTITTPSDYITQIPEYTSSTNYCYFVLNKSNNAGILTIPSSFIDGTYILIIEYTKTTD